MRKLTVVLALVIVSLSALTAPALAQRDPFDPVIDPNAATTTTTTTGGTTTTTDGTVTEPGVPGSIGSERIADTGADVTPFLVIAFTFLALGGLALAWARLNHPQAHRI